LACRNNIVIISVGNSAGYIIRISGSTCFDGSAFIGNIAELIAAILFILLLNAGAMAEKAVWQSCGPTGVIDTRVKIRSVFQGGVMASDSEPENFLGSTPQTPLKWSF